MKYIFGSLLVLVIISQIFISLRWMSLKTSPSIQENSSIWIIKNLPKGAEIGLENVPIYQGIPDFIKKEFYYEQEKVGKDNLITYRIID